MQIKNLLNINSFVHSVILLSISNFLIFSAMFLIYLLGKNSFLSDILIYAPISAIIIVLIRELLFLYLKSIPKSFLEVK